MTFSNIVLLSIDVISISLIFWLIPDVIARFIKSRVEGSGPRPVRFLVDQLPGLIVGTVFGAFVLYLTGVSYENFIVNTGRTIGNTALEAMGLDEMTICARRMILEHFPTTSEQMFREIAASYRDSGSPTLKTSESILLHGRNLIMIDSSAPNVMERAVEEHCRFMVGQGSFER